MSSTASPSKTAADTKPVIISAEDDKPQEDQSPDFVTIRLKGNIAITTKTINIDDDWKREILEKTWGDDLSLPRDVPRSAGTDSYWTKMEQYAILAHASGIIMAEPCSEWRNPRVKGPENEERQMILHTPEEGPASWEQCLHDSLRRAKGREELMQFQERLRTAGEAVGKLIEFELFLDFKSDAKTIDLQDNCDES
ncbi:hypothetical protein KEM56_001166 [Ascosphaera pollenicola]|nr:hypothetical protein KEM56_001166 [Ascosphaera pollenicola]